MLHDRSVRALFDTSIPPRDEDGDVDGVREEEMATSVTLTPPGLVDSASAVGASDSNHVGSVGENSIQPNSSFPPGQANFMDTMGSSGVDPAGRGRTGSSMSTTTATDDALREHRKLPIAVVLQGVIILIVIGTSVGVSGLMFTYTENALDPIVESFTQAVTHHIANGPALTLNDASKTVVDMQHRMEWVSRGRTGGIIRPYSIFRLVLEPLQVYNNTPQPFVSVYIGFPNGSIWMSVPDGTVLERHRNPATNKTDEVKHYFDPVTLKRRAATTKGDTSDYLTVGRPWYLAAMKSAAATPVWSDIYLFTIPVTAMGITVSARTPLGVVAVDFTLMQLSSFLSAYNRDRLATAVAIVDMISLELVAHSSGEGEASKLDELNDVIHILKREGQLNSKREKLQGSWFRVRSQPISGVLGDNFKWVALVLVRESEALKELNASKRLVLLLAAGISFAFCVGSSILIHGMLRPFSILLRFMKKIARLKLNEVLNNTEQLSRARSSIKELDIMSVAFAHMVNRLEEYKKYMAAFSLDDGNDGDDDNEEATRTVRVSVIYLSRLSGRNKTSATFDFPFCNDPNVELFATFKRQLTTMLHENPFEPLAVIAHVAGVGKVVLYNDDTLREVLTLSPSELYVTVEKTGRRDYAPVVCIAFDILNSTSNVYIVVRTLGAVEDIFDTGLFGILTFVALTLFSHLTSIFVCFTLLRNAAGENEVLQQWIQENSPEFTISLFASALIPVNMRLNWSLVRFSSILRFNAPYSKRLYERLVVASIFPYCVLVYQWCYKLFTVMSSSDAATLSIALLGFLASALVLITHGVTLGRDLKKWRAELLARDKAIERAKKGENLPVQCRRRENSRHWALHVRELSILVIRLQLGNTTSVVGLTEDCNRFYTLAFSLVQRHRGTVLSFSEGTVIATFNAPRSDENHVLEALECALQLRDDFPVAKLEATMCVTTGNFPFGLIGTSKRQTYHCLADINLLVELAELAPWLGVTIIATHAIVPHIRRYPRRFRLRGVEQLPESDEYLPNHFEKGLCLYELTRGGGSGAKRPVLLPRHRQALRLLSACGLDYHGRRRTRQYQMYVLTPYSDQAARLMHSLADCIEASQDALQLDADAEVKRTRAANIQRAHARRAVQRTTSVSKMFMQFGLSRKANPLNTTRRLSNKANIGSSNSPPNPQESAEKEAPEGEGGGDPQIVLLAQPNSNQPAKARSNITTVYCSRNNSPSASSKYNDNDDDNARKQGDNESGCSLVEEDDNDDENLWAPFDVGDDEEEWWLRDSLFGDGDGAPCPSELWEWEGTAPEVKDGGEKEDSSSSSSSSSPSMVERQTMSTHTADDLDRGAGGAQDTSQSFPTLSSRRRLHLDDL